MGPYEQRKGTCKNWPVFVPTGAVDDVINARVPTVVSGAWGLGKTTLLRAFRDHPLAGNVLGREVLGRDVLCSDVVGGEVVGSEVGGGVVGGVEVVGGEMIVVDDVDLLPAEAQLQLAGDVAAGRFVVLATRDPSRLRPELTRVLLDAGAQRLQLGTVGFDTVAEWRSKFAPGVSAERIGELLLDAGGNGRVLHALLRDETIPGNSTLLTVQDALLSELAPDGRSTFDALAVAGRLRVDMVERVFGPDSLRELEALQVVDIEDQASGTWVTLRSPALARSRAEGLGHSGRRALLRVLLRESTADEHRHHPREFLMQRGEWSLASGGESEAIRSGMHAAMGTGQFDRVFEFANELLLRDARDIDAATCMSMAYEARGEHAQAAAVNRLVQSSDTSWTMRYRANALLAAKAAPEPNGDDVDVTFATDPLGEGQATISWFHLFSGDVEGAAKITAQVLGFAGASAQARVWAAFAHVSARVVLGDGPSCLATLDAIELHDGDRAVNPFADLQMVAARLFAVLRTGDPSRCRSLARERDAAETVPLLRSVWRGYSGLAARELGLYTEAVDDFGFVLDTIDGDPWGVRSWVEKRTGRLSGDGRGGAPRGRCVG